MSYAMAVALQAALHARLSGDAELSDAVGGAIHDAAPPADPRGTHVLIGAEEALDRSDKTGGGAEHRLVISVISDAAGFLQAKAAAVRISDLLAGADMELSRGRLVGLWFDRAEAKRERGGRVRRIDLRFRARVEDD